QEQRDPDQHLVRRGVLGAERLPDEAQDDQDPREPGDREQERRDDRQAADQQQDLQCVASVDLHERAVILRKLSSTRPNGFSTTGSVLRDSSEGTSMPSAIASASL